jgi:hypothetical protein
MLRTRASAPNGFTMNESIPAVRGPLALTAQRAGRQRDDRQIRKPQLEADSSRRIVAVEHRHLDVHQHHVEASSARPAGARRPPGRCSPAQTCAPSSSRMRLVTSRLMSLSSTTSTRTPSRARSPASADESSCPARASGEASSEVQHDLEFAAHARGALQAHLAAHQVGQALDDREAEPGAAEAPGDRGVRLRERREQPRLHLGRDADAGVPHDEGQGHALGPAGAPADAQLDAAPLGELDRVGEQVGQDLGRAPRRTRPAASGRGRRRWSRCRTPR